MPLCGEPPGALQRMGYLLHPSLKREEACRNMLAPERCHPLKSKPLAEEPLLLPAALPFRPTARVDWTRIQSTQ